MLKQFYCYYFEKDSTLVLANSDILILDKSLFNDAYMYGIENPEWNLENNAEDIPNGIVIDKNLLFKERQNYG